MPLKVERTMTSIACVLSADRVLLSYCRCRLAVLFASKLCNHHTDSLTHSLTHHARPGVVVEVEAEAPPVRDRLLTERLGGGKGL